MGPPSAREAPAPEAPEFTHYGVNTFGLCIGGQRLLVDPLLTEDLTFFGQRWAFEGRRRPEAVAAAPEPERVFEMFDAVVLTQGLEDHTHLPTLRRIDRRTLIIGSPRAAAVARDLGFQHIQSLRPGGTRDGLQLGHLRIIALPGSVVGPPWDDPENGYIFQDTRPGGLAFGAEPHGNFLGPAMGTSLRLLPKAPPVDVDALLMPLATQKLWGYPLVFGWEQGLATLEALRRVPRFVLPLKNAEIDMGGALMSGMSEEGSAGAFEEQLLLHPRLKGLRFLDVQPGSPVLLT